MVPQVTAKTSLPTISPELEDVALVDAKMFAAAGSVSVGWVYAEVREGRAPQPVMRSPRCTRWRLIDVRNFWRQRAEQTTENSAAAAQVQARAEKASSKARAVRAASKAAHLASV